MHHRGGSASRRTADAAGRSREALRVRGSSADLFALHRELNARRRGLGIKQRSILQLQGTFSASLDGLRTQLGRIARVALATTERTIGAGQKNSNLSVR